MRALTMGFFFGCWAFLPQMYNQSLSKSLSSALFYCPGRHCGWESLNQLMEPHQTASGRLRGGGNAFGRAVYAARSLCEPWRYRDTTKLLLLFYYMVDCRCFRNSVADNIFLCAVNMMVFSGGSWGCFLHFSAEP